MSMGVFVRSAACFASVLALCAACATFVASDPRAIGPRYDRWEVVVAQPRWAVFNAARDVLADSGYVLAQANMDVGAISTADRRASPVAPGTQQTGTEPGSVYPVRLSLMMTPQGRDSTRLSITGQYRRANTTRTGTVDVRSEEWRLVRGIGEAILSRLR